MRRGRARTRSGSPASVDAGTASVAICNWRDLTHPDGGGSELYVETVARHLAERGNDVTVLCAHVAGQPAEEVRDGVRYLRAGNKLTVYPLAAWAIRRGRVRADVVMEVQNGIPFLSSLVTRLPQVVLLHHVHREQWPLVYGRIGGALGWAVESRLGPWLYRRARYVTVSECTRAELAHQGIAPERVAVAYNGNPVVVASSARRSPTPRVVVLGRLVPHKRVEVALHAAAELRHRFPDLHVDVVGQGWWSPRLTDLAHRLGLDDVVTFHGFVDEQTKADLLARAWVGAVPSLKEGWGLSVVEAASHGTPSIAFAGAGGLSESIRAGETGVLVGGPAPTGPDGGSADDVAEYTAALGELLAHPERCAALGANARAHAATFTWEATAARVAAELDRAIDPTMSRTSSPTASPARDAAGSRSHATPVTPEPIVPVRILRPHLLERSTTP